MKTHKCLVLSNEERNHRAKFSIRSECNQVIHLPLSESTAYFSLQGAHAARRCRDRGERVLLQGSAPESEAFVSASETEACFYKSSKRREIKCELESERGLRIDGWRRLTCTRMHTQRRACVFTRPYIDRSVGSWQEFKHYKDVRTRACV